MLCGLQIIESHRKHKGDVQILYICFCCTQLFCLKCFEHFLAKFSMISISPPPQVTELNVSLTSNVPIECANDKTCSVFTSKSDILMFTFIIDILFLFSFQHNFLFLSINPLLTTHVFCLHGFIMHFHIQNYFLFTSLYSAVTLRYKHLYILKKIYCAYIYMYVYLYV